MVDIDSLFKTTDDPQDKSIYRISGGIGDVIICCGVIASHNQHVEIAVRPHHMSLMERIQGIAKVISLKNFTPSYYRDFRIVGNFDGLFALGQKLIDKSYYAAAASRARGLLKTAKFRINAQKEQYPTVALHAGASNLNRRWLPEKWFHLAAMIEKAGYDIMWLGSKDDFGQTTKRQTKLADTNEDLSYQLDKLSGCDFFVGNDSGFCHIAGCIGIKGYVLFSNTYPENVISEYKTLEPIHVEPYIASMSLEPHDWQSHYNLDNLSVDMVCDAIDVPYSDVTTLLKEHKTKITILGEEEIDIFYREVLEKEFEVTESSNLRIWPSKQKIELDGRHFDFLGGPYDLKPYLNEIRND